MALVRYCKSSAEKVRLPACVAYGLLLNVRSISPIGLVISDGDC
jgi:hypothetical protein